MLSPFHGNAYAFVFRVLGFFSSGLASAFAFSALGFAGFFSAGSFAALGFTAFFSGAGSALGFAARGFFYGASRSMFSYRLRYISALWLQE